MNHINHIILFILLLSVILISVLLLSMILLSVLLLSIILLSFGICIFVNFYWIKYLLYLFHVNVTIKNINDNNMDINIIFFR